MKFYLSTITITIVYIGAIGTINSMHYRARVECVFGESRLIWSAKDTSLQFGDREVLGFPWPFLQISALNNYYFVTSDFMCNLVVWLFFWGILLYLDKIIQSRRIRPVGRKNSSQGNKLKKDA